MAASEYLVNAIAKHFLCGQPMPSTDVWLAIFTDEGEVATARQKVIFSAEGGVACNAEAESFTADGAAFGLVTGWALFTAETGGEKLHSGKLLKPKQIDDSDTLDFDPGMLKITQK